MGPHLANAAKNSYSYGYIRRDFMAAYSVAEAKNTLPRLLDRAIEGEKVIITRHGKPVAEIRSLPAERTPMSREQRLALIDDFTKRRQALPPLDISAADLIRQMRDEGV
ncbi:MAG: type II toxin-antitoxin system prevent-host-death family antitoxin [Brevundimonas sp.]